MLYSRVRWTRNWGHATRRPRRKATLGVMLDSRKVSFLHKIDTLGPSAAPRNRFIAAHVTVKLIRCLGNRPPPSLGVLSTPHVQLRIATTQPFKGPLILCRHKINASPSSGPDADGHPERKAVRARHMLKLNKTSFLESGINKAGGGTTSPCRSGTHGLMSPHPHPRKSSVVQLPNLDKVSP